MTGHTKRTCYRRGKWRFNVGILCCTLLISLFVSTNLVVAAPLTRVSPPGDLSDAWKHKWLAGVQTSSVSPPEGLSEIQEMEWAIGTITASASLCGYYGKVAKVQTFMKKSIHFERGYNDVMDFYDSAQNCSRYATSLDTVLGEKEEWEYYLDVTYPD